MRINKSKKCVKKSRRVNNKNRRKRVYSKKRIQQGGGPLNSMLSMIPFMPKMGGGETTNIESNSQINQQNSQNVLVGALCNQFVKNNIKGNNASMYDGVLDNLCSNQQVGMTQGVNSIYGSNSIAQNNIVAPPIQQINSDNNNNNSQSTAEQEGGDIKVPTFLKGVKGIAQLYSKPLRMGINAIQGLTKSKSKKDTSSDKESKSKLSLEEKLLKKSKKYRKHRKHKKHKSKKKKKKHYGNTIDDDIKRAEEEIQEKEKEE